MTTVFLVWGDIELMQVAIADKAQSLAFWDVRGPRAEPAWTPPEIDVLFEPREPEPKWVPTDCPNFSSLHLMLSRRAIDALAPLIGPHGEFLPVSASLGDYAIFNTFTELDAFDDARTEGRRHPDGRLWEILRYALRPEAMVDAPPIFRLSGERAPFFVTDAFHDAVLRARLTGFVFTPAWNSETGGIALPKVETWDRNPAAKRRAAAAKRRALIEAEAQGG